MRMLPRFACVGIAVTCAIATIAFAGEPFIDDFEDGSATDGNPVNWIHQIPPFDQGVAEVTDGAFHLTPSPTAPPIPVAGIGPEYIELQVLAEGHVYQDVSVHTLISVSGQESYAVGVQARDTAYIDQALGVAVWATLSMDSFGNKRVHLGGATDGGVFPGLARQTTLNAQESDVHLQLDIVGDTAKVFAWADGDEMPTSPQLTRQVDTTQMVEGNVILWYGQDRPPIQSLQTATFRFVEVVPEPSSSALVFAAVISVFVSQRKRLRSTYDHR